MKKKTMAGGESSSEASKGRKSSMDFDQYSDKDEEEKKKQAQQKQQLSSVSVLGKRKATHLPVREDAAAKAAKVVNGVGKEAELGSEAVVTMAQ